jgi:hypothetical protein
MKKYIITALSLLLFSGFAVSQTAPDLKEIETQINMLANQMHSDTSLANRQSYADEIKKLMQDNLTQKGSYTYPFTDIKGVSMLQPADKKFRIFTWEMFVDKNTYKQFGIIQTSDEKIYTLEDKSEEMVKQAEFLRLKPENWYGALYYHIQPYTTANNETHYLLLGRDSYSFYERRKVVEILYFDFMSRPRFGNSVIQVKDGQGRMRMVNRYFLQYTTIAAVTLRYDPQLNLVVFDHLVTGAPLEPGAPISYMPDGSFNGLKLVKGKWDFVDMVFKYDSDNVLENAVNPTEIMLRNDKKRDGDKDIFGKDTKTEKEKKKSKKEMIIQP